MITLPAPSEVVSDRELGVFEVLVWLVLVYVLVLTVISAYRKFIRDGDVLAEARAATAEATKVLDENDTIESYLTDWMGIAPRTAVEEVRALDAERTPPLGRLGVTS